MNTLITLMLLVPGVGRALAQPDRPAPPPAHAIRQTPFPDVPRDHWAYHAVEELRKLGILIGYPPRQETRPTPPRRQPSRRK